MSQPQPAIDLINDQIKSQTKAKPGAKAINIAIDGNEANVSNRVGSNIYAFHLLQALYKLKTKHRFTIYLKNPPLSDFPPPHENWQYKIIPFPKLWSQIRLPFELLTNRPDVFFSPGHYVSPFIPCPVVISLLDLAYLTHPSYFKKSDLFQLTQWTKQSVAKASHILTISQHSQNDIIKHYKYPRSNITVTYPGINHDLYKFPQTDAAINRVKKHYGITKDYILYVGTLQPRKNLPNLIQAFQKLNAPNYQLVIAGKKGWLYEDIFQTVKKLNLEKKVIFTDFVPDEDLPPLMAGARCLSNVSLYEGFGIPVIEAQAVGTPAVVSNVSSLPEILGNAGIKATTQPTSITQALKKIISLTDKQYYALTDKAVAHAHMFTWEHTAKLTIEILERTAS